MSQHLIELIARLRSADIPDTEEFAQSFAEIQQELRVGAQSKSPTYVVKRLSEAQARLFLTAVLQHLEKFDLPKMIADAETLRRQLGLPSMLFKRMGDFL